jgi:hypothetical protein
MRLANLAVRRKLDNRFFPFGLCSKAAPRCAAKGLPMSTPSVSKVSQNKDTTDTAEPGQLDLYPDGSWQFAGNGESSAKDVASRIIDYEKTQPNADPAYQAMRPDVLAKMLMDAPENSELNNEVGGDVAKPIPKAGTPGMSNGRTTFNADTATLKQIVGVLAQYEQQMRAGLTMAEKSSATDRVTGNVRSNGLTLPYDPS